MASAGVITATVSGKDEVFDLTHLDFAGGTIFVPQLDVAAGRTIRVRIRARDVSLAVSPPAGISILNVFPGTVQEIAADGAFADIVVDIGARIWARITARSLHELNLGVGSPVFALVKAVAIDRHSLGRAGPPRGADAWGDAD